MLNMELTVPGSEAYDWLCQELRCTREEAKKYGEALIFHGSIQPLNCSSFVDKFGAFYKFSVCLFDFFCLIILQVLSIHENRDERNSVNTVVDLNDKGILNIK